MNSPRDPEAAKGRDSLTRELTLPAVTGNLYPVLDFVAGMLEEIRFPPDEAARVTVALEEVFANVAMYAYAPDVGSVRVVCTLAKDPPSVSLTLMDRGRPFNPLLNQSPDTSLSLEDRKIGGLGVHIARSFMDSVAYRYEEGQNILTLTKRISR